MIFKIPCPVEIEHSSVVRNASGIRGCYFFYDEGEECCVSSKKSVVMVILNPTAGKGRARKMIPRIKTLLEAHRVRYELIVTEYAGHAIKIAEDAAVQGYKAAVAAGGDGTCNEVANGLLKAGIAAHNTAFFAFPIGRGNDFAFSAGIPKRLDKTVEELKNDTIHYIDAGCVYGGDYPEGRYFINGLGVGFEPLVNLVASSYTRISGALSYLAAVVRIMRNYPEAVPVNISYGKKLLNLETQQVSLCNGRRMGGVFFMGPDAVIDDGKLDLCYVNQPVSGGRILYLVTRFLRGTQKSHPAISFDRTEDVEMTTADGSERIICHIDGEMVTAGANRITVVLHPASLPVIG